MYDRADIILIPFPYTDLTIGKLRPAIILSNAKLNSTQDRICCLITSQPTTEGLEIKPEDLSTPLPYLSWIKPHRIFTISQHIIKKKISRANEKLCSQVISELNTYIE